jgi:YesN/AraC family two-component response regulator
MHLFGIGNLHYYKDTPKGSQISYLDLKTSDYIINLVMSASEHSLEDYFNNICQQLKQRKLSSEDAKSCLYFFYNVFMRLKTRLQHQFPYKTLEGLFVLDSQFFTCSLLEAIKYIEKPFTQAALMVKEQSSNNLDKKIHEVTQYIESNYLDINLNLNNIAAHFNITPSYLSKKFREEHGISIIDYLYKVRISYSVDLIRNTSLKITDIAPMVGFQDSNAFIRIFKKYHGCTPGNYKSTVLKSED